MLIVFAIAVGMTALTGAAAAAGLKKMSKDLDYPPLKEGDEFAAKYMEEDGLKYYPNEPGRIGKAVRKIGGHQ